MENTALAFPWRFSPNFAAMGFNYLTGKGSLSPISVYLNSKGIGSFNFFRFLGLALKQYPRR
jgi:hypothetical protein